MMFARPYDRSDAEFLTDLSRGNRAEQAAAQILIASGLHVEITPKRARPVYSARQAYNDGGLDLRVDGLPIQVKCRFGYTFKGPESFPFDTVTIDSKQGFDACCEKVVAYVLVSGDLAAIVVAPAPWSHASIHRRVDPTRHGANREFVDVPRESLLSGDQFERWVRLYRFHGGPPP